jgi:hypothetical protein
MNNKSYNGLTLTEITENFDSTLIKNLAHDLLVEKRLNKDLIEGQIAEPEEELEFTYQNQKVGIDKFGTYQIGLDGNRHDATPNYVLQIANLRITELEELLQKTKNKK